MEDTCAHDVSILTVLLRQLPFFICARYMQQHVTLLQADCRELLSNISVLKYFTTGLAEVSHKSRGLQASLAVCK